jgi:lipopolysaccharide transport system permease protein
MINTLKQLWSYRGFILGSVKREFQSKYNNSILGVLWNVLNPLSMIIVYTVIFSEVMRTRMVGVEGTYSYSIYLCSGIIVWGLFSEITGRAQNTFIENANLLKKISFPRICLPIIVVINASLNFAIIFTLFTLFLIISGNFPGLPFLAIVPLLLIQLLFSIGLGVSLGVLNVFFRDVGQFFNLALQFWFWLTPIVYLKNILPSFAQRYIEYNPMVGLIEAYHSVMVHKEWPHWQDLWLISVLALVFCSLGFYLFKKHIGEMLDEL